MTAPASPTKTEGSGAVGRDAPRPQPFHTVPKSAFLRQFPAAYREHRPVEFHPEQPLTVNADVLEIGPGRGDFLLAEAAAHPTQHFIALEIGKKRYLKLVQRVLRCGLSNVLLICGDARILLPRYFPNHSCGSVVILYPDPWPKRRHAFNRLLQPEFLREIARLLKPGGRMYLKSDVESYVEWVAEQIRHLPQLRIVEDSWPWGALRSENGSLRSLYADRQSNLGYSIHSLTIQKV